MSSIEKSMSLQRGAKFDLKFSNWKCLIFCSFCLPQEVFVVVFELFWSKILDFQHLGHPDGCQQLGHAKAKI